MKKTLLFLLLFFAASLTFAQGDTATIFTDIDFNIVDKAKADLMLKSYKMDNSGYIYEKYNSNKVLLLRETYSDNNLQIKHGAYGEYRNGKLIYKGAYSKGNREGIFMSYDTLGRVLETKTFLRDSATGPNLSYWSNGNKREEGNYLNNTRVGLWVKYYKNGNVAIKETFSDKKIDLLEIEKLKKKDRRAAFQKLRYLDSLFLDINGQPTTREKIGTEAIYPGGIEKFYEFIAKSVKYPHQARDKGLQGTVVLSFTINEKGEIEDLRVESAAYPILVKEALRVVRLTKNWTPATLAGEKISVKTTFPIKFSL
jgi:TonB family protein